MIGMPPAGENRQPIEPGERQPSAPARESRRLAEPPSTRYAEPAPATTGAGGGVSALRGPLTRAMMVALGGAVLLTFVGAILASTEGLLFVAGVTGGAVGLVLSRAAAPGPEADPVPRTRIARLAVGLSVAAVALAALATWIYARGEGGTLGPIDYLLTTFGPLVPGEAVIAAVTAWWGARIGPVQS
jgi:hypothetical protein